MQTYSRPFYIGLCALEAFPRPFTPLAPTAAANGFVASRDYQKFTPERGWNLPRAGDDVLALAASRSARPWLSALKEGGQPARPPADH